MKKNLLVLIIITLAFGLYGQNGTPTAAVKPDLNFGKFPLYFIINKGQVNKKASFYAKASRYTLWLTKDGLVFDSIKRDKGDLPHSPYSPHSPHSPKTHRDVSRLIFVNANKDPEMVPIKETKLRVNYFKGNDKSKWYGNIPTSQAVLYKNLYKNIDLKVYGIEKQIEYDWIVKPGGNPEDIRFEYKNVKGTRLDHEGNLLIETELGELMHKRPVSYQEMSMGHGAWSMEKKEGRRDVDVQFKKIGKNTYGFKWGEYDKQLELIIDPVVLAYSTYLGGGGEDYGQGIAVDNSGYVYVTGTTYSTDFPTLNQYQADQVWRDVFVTKLDTTQSGAASLIYSTYLGGGDSDQGRGIAVDNSGCTYVTGYTESTDFPTLNQYQADQPFTDVFVTKLDTTQSGAASLIYSTYLGGSTWADYGEGIAVDKSGYAYVIGTTQSTDFPTPNQYQTDPGDSATDVFVSKLDTTRSGASSLIYSTYLGGGSYDFGDGIATDSSGYAYVTGGTGSTNFPTLNQYQTDPGDGYCSDVFVTKLDTTQSGASSLIYSTYLGGGSYDYGDGIAVDNSGFTYVTGATVSTDFPTLNQYQTYQASYDVFVTKLDTTQSGAASFIYSTYLGGGSYDFGFGIAVDNSGYAYVTGETNSTDFPTLNQYQADQPFSDVFVTKLDTTQSGASSLISSTYLGGFGHEAARGIAVDDIGYAYVTGWTESTDFPTLNQYQTHQGSFDGFVTKLILPPISLISPNGGESWQGGATRNIIFNAANISGNLSIFLFKDGSALGNIVRHIDPASGSYQWTVGQYEGGTAAAGTGYTIKVKEMGAHLSDFSDAPFTICALTVTSPNGAENWKSSSAQNITWNAQEITGNLKIYLWKNGALVGTIAKNLDPGSGSYPWVVGQYEGGKAAVGTGYTIKIKEMGVHMSDFSDAPFNITGITVTSPNGGESWQIGANQNITWTTQGVSGNLKIFLYKNGIMVGTIAKNLNPAAGFFAWTVGQYEGGTASTGTGYTIKIKEMGVTGCDFSDSAFSLTN